MGFVFRPEVGLEILVPPLDVLAGPGNVVGRRGRRA